MTRRELAQWLSLHVRAQRLRRAGIDPSEPHVELAQMQESEQQNWLDMADAVLAFNRLNDPLTRLQSLSADWTFYTTTVADEEERRSWQRCVIVEMRAEINRLAKECE